MKYVSPIALIFRVIGLWVFFLSSMLWIEVSLFFGIGDPYGLLNITENVKDMALGIKSDAEAMIEKMDREDRG